MNILVSFCFNFWVSNFTEFTSVEYEMLFLYALILNTVSNTAVLKLNFQLLFSQYVYVRDLRSEVKIFISGIFFKAIFKY